MLPDLEHVWPGVEQWKGGFPSLSLSAPPLPLNMFNSHCSRQAAMKGDDIRERKGSREVGLEAINHN